MSNAIRADADGGALPELYYAGVVREMLARWIEIGIVLLVEEMLTGVSDSESSR